jgi:hypothetical protein
MASLLIYTRPNHELINLGADESNCLAWQHIYRLDLDLDMSFTDVFPSD